MHAGATAETKHGLKRLSPLWALAWVPLAPLLFPPVLICYGGIAFAQEAWIKGGFLLFSLSLWFHLDRDTRRRLNDNVTRVESALAAREAAAAGSEPAALILRSFAREQAYRDGGANFSLYELIDPALRATGFRPLALGTALPLPSEHGVAFFDTSDEGWWDAFCEIARDAAVILVSPEDTPSLRREVAWLAAEGRLAKLALLMAPEPLDIVYYTTADGGVERGPAGPKKERADGWRETRRIWRDEFDVDLPDYDPRGALIVFPEAGGTPWSRPLRAFAKERWIDAAKRVIRGYGYGVDFAAVWRAALAERGWNGPPVSGLWRRLAPAPLAIRPRARFHPPGESGKVGETLPMIACIGWGSVLGLVVIWAIS